MSKLLLSPIMLLGAVPTNVLCGMFFICLACFLPSASAFGSGNIPDAAYLKGKAWRHGDIEDTLEGLVKVAGQSGGAIVGAIASALFSGGAGGLRRATGGRKFSSLDVKRIYFGNWLRDLSQVCDIAGFKAMTAESLVVCIMTMGFLSFGYATREFQVTRERLAVYLLTEHIDNPKGYGEGEDPQRYDSRLRPRVDEERELRIDERNGMKMYIASDDQSFDTSTKAIRRVFRQCIELGRQARQEDSEEKEHESFRLLGTGLHTLEDFSAHSNWCELALQKLGHKQVFAHVGENVRINSPEGPVPPLVTGTFAGADFCFSMLGEASDKLSSASIADLTAQLDDAQTESKKSGGIDLNFIKSVLSKLPLGGGSNGVDEDLASMEQKKQAFDLDGRIDQLAPEELQKKIWDIFVVRDNLMRRIEELIEGVPGLGQLLENLSTSLARWIMVTIDPFVRPILLQASSAIGQGSQAVISGHDQWTVFNDPDASDPTHSVLAKDHFSNILNDPAGNISVIIVKYTVGLMVDAWSSDENPDSVIDKILEAIHHPYYAKRNSTIQREMLDYMRRWLDGLDSDDRELTIESLTKDSIRNHRNQRRTSEGGLDPRLGGVAPPHGHAHPGQQKNTGYGTSQQSGYNRSNHVETQSPYETQYGSQQSVYDGSSNRADNPYEYKYGSQHVGHGGSSNRPDCQSSYGNIQDRRSRVCEYGEQPAFSQDRRNELASNFRAQDQCQNQDYGEQTDGGGTPGARVSQHDVDYTAKSSGYSGASNNPTAISRDDGFGSAYGRNTGIIDSQFSSENIDYGRSNLAFSDRVSSQNYAASYPPNEEINNPQGIGEYGSGLASAKGNIYETNVGGFVSPEYKRREYEGSEPRVVSRTTVSYGQEASAYRAGGHGLGEEPDRSAYPSGYDKNDPGSYSALRREGDQPKSHNRDRSRSCEKKSHGRKSRSHSREKKSHGRKSSSRSREKKSHGRKSRSHSREKTVRYGSEDNNSTQQHRPDNSEYRNYGNTSPNEDTRERYVAAGHNRHKSKDSSSSSDSRSDKHSHKHKHKHNKSKPHDRNEEENRTFGFTRNDEQSDQNGDYGLGRLRLQDNLRGGDDSYGHRY